MELRKEERKAQMQTMMSYFFAYTVRHNVLIGMLLLEDAANSIDPFRIMNWNPRLIVITTIHGELMGSFVCSPFTIYFSHILFLERTCMIYSHERQLFCCR